MTDRQTDIHTYRQTYRSTREQIKLKTLFSKAMSTCSFISAILVIFIHSYNIAVYSNASSPIIYWFEEAISQGLAKGAVPFFFMSSALFLYSSKKKTADVYKSRFKTLVIPYLLWNTIFMIAFTVLRKLSLTNVGLDAINIGNILKGIFLYKCNYVYWFMFYLIIFTLLYPVIRYVISKNKFICFSGLAVLVIAYFYSSLTQESGLSKIFENSIYYYIGAIIGFYYREGVEKVVAIPQRKIVLVTLLLLIFGAVMFFAVNVCGINLTILRNIAMTLLIFFISVASDITIPKLLLGLSFMIYSMHSIILEMIEKTIYIVFPHTNLWMLIDYVIAPLICLSVVVAVCILMRKHCQKIYVLLNGGRT